jgi:hypothetical protein
LISLSKIISHLIRLGAVMIDRPPNCRCLPLEALGNINIHSLYLGFINLGQLSTSQQTIIGPRSLGVSRELLAAFYRSASLTHIPSRKLAVLPTIAPPRIHSLVTQPTAEARPILRIPAHLREARSQSQAKPSPGTLPRRRASDFSHPDGGSATSTTSITMPYVRLYVAFQSSGTTRAPEHPSTRAPELNI